MAKIKKVDYTFAAGKRKSAIARVRLFKGKGESLINDKPLGKYFGGVHSDILYLKPLTLTQNVGKYHISARVIGGGTNSQLEAFVHATAKALSKSDVEKYRSVLKKSGLLTRDSRIRERRKIGMGGKSRRKKQSPKR